MRIIVKNINLSCPNRIKNILISVGKIDLINADPINNPHASKASISRTVNDLYTQERQAKLNSSSKGRNYSFYKYDICFEEYFTKLPKYTAL